MMQDVLSSLHSLGAVFQDTTVAPTKKVRKPSNTTIRISSLTWRLPARGYEWSTNVRCSPRVRVHRHVRKRYLWYAASRAMPTKSTTTARRMMPARRSMAIVYLFDQCGARFAYAQEKRPRPTGWHRKHQ